MNIDRVIILYDKNTEDIYSEININDWDFNILKKIISPPDNDPLMYDCYWIEEIHIQDLRTLLKCEIDFLFDKYIYQIECFQVSNN